MTRFWHESVAGLGDLVPGGVPALGEVLLGLTAVVSLLWYWWPDWLPGRGHRGSRGRGPGRRRGWPRLRWPRWPRWPRWRRRFRWRWAFRWPRWPRWRRRFRWRWALRWPRWRRRRAAPEHADLPPDRLPDLPAAALARSADELAAQGRYREAVRERLRAIVRDLVERDVITHRPGWTVTELAVAAGRARPATAAALAAASEIFSGIWYGQRPADAWHDAAMRDLAARVRAGTEQRVGV